MKCFMVTFVVLESFHLTQRFVFLQMPNIKKLVAGDLVYDGVKQLTMTLVDPIQLFITAAGQDENTYEYQPWELIWSLLQEKTEGQHRRRKPIKRKIDVEEVKLTGPEKDSINSGNENDTDFCFKLVLRDNGLTVKVGDVCRVNHLGLNTFF